MTLQGAEQETLHSKLAQDYRAGQISRASYLAYQLQAAENPQQLPPPYRTFPVEPGLCSTLIAGEARALMDSLTGQEKNMLASVLSRPDSMRLPLRTRSPKGYFVLHHANSGADSSSDAFIAEAGQSFDYVYDLLVHEMGYNPPPDDLEAGGTPELDVYVMQFYLYGETRFEQSVPGSNGERFTSYIVIDNNFMGSGFETKGLDALHVTAAHEFFHMLQGGYRYFPKTKMDSRFLFEASSVWFEDAAYDEVNDYLQYVRSFFKSPYFPFHSYSKVTYGIGLYMMMLEKRHDRNLIRRIWEELSDQEPLTALSTALASRSDQLGTSLAHFAVWNGYTSDHADTINFYPESHLYPLITETGTNTYTSPLVIEGEASELVTHHHRIQVPMGGTVQVTPSFNRPADWIYSVTVFDAVKADHYHVTAGNGTKILNAISSGSELLLAVTNISLPLSNYSQNSQSYTFLISSTQQTTALTNGITLIAPSPFKLDQGRSLQIQYRLPQPEPSLNLYIMTEHGRIIYQQHFQDVPDGLNCFFWDGRNAQGQISPAGVYICYLRGNRTWPPQKFAVIR